MKKVYPINTGIMLVSVLVVTGCANSQYEDGQVEEVAVQRQSLKGSSEAADNSAIEAMLDKKLPTYKDDLLTKKPSNKESIEKIYKKPLEKLDKIKYTKYDVLSSDMKPMQNIPKRFTAYSSNDEDSVLIVDENKSKWQFGVKSAIKADFHNAKKDAVHEGNDNGKAHAAIRDLYETFDLPNSEIGDILTKGFGTQPGPSASVKRMGTLATITRKKGGIPVDRSVFKASFNLHGDLQEIQVAWPPFVMKESSGKVIPRQAAIKQLAAKMAPKGKGRLKSIKRSELIYWLDTEEMKYEPALQIRPEYVDESGKPDQFSNAKVVTYSLISGEVYEY